MPGLSSSAVIITRFFLFQRFVSVCYAMVFLTNA